MTAQVPGSISDTTLDGTERVDINQGPVWVNTTTQAIANLAAAPVAPFTITGANANALDVGPNGATNPTLQIDTSTASAATGIKVKSAAAAGGVAVSTVSSGTNESLTIDAKGTGTLTLQGTATGNIIAGRTISGTNAVMTSNYDSRTATATPAAAAAVAAYTMGSATIGIYWGTGDPNTALTAAKGSLYIRADGSSVSTRMYVNSDGATTWASVTTSA